MLRGSFVEGKWTQCGEIERGFCHVAAVGRMALAVAVDTGGGAVLSEGDIDAYSQLSQRPQREGMHIGVRLHNDSASQM